MIVGLVSTWAEGELLEGAVRSALHGCDRVLVLNAPIRGGEGTQHRDFVLAAEDQRVTVRNPTGKVFADDAAKRNALLAWAKELGAMAKWCIWVDGDERLMFGEQLRDWARRAEYITGAGGFPLRVVELDGSVAYAYGRVFRPDAVDSFLVGAAQVVTTDGSIVQLPNEKVCRAGGVPWGSVPMRQLPDRTVVPVEPDSDEMEAFLAKHRPPVAGEPHILHISLMRSPDRNVQRQHEAEAEKFDEAFGKKGQR